jgi:hypothetical protein
MADIIDPPPEAHTHHHPTGHRWLDKILAVCAVVISCISVLLAFQHGAAMEEMVKQNERMVQANTWPYVMVFFSTADEAGNSLFKIGVVNNGVGPARIGSVRVEYQGKPTKDVRGLAARVAHDAGHDVADVQQSDIGGVLPARQTVNILSAKDPFSPAWLIDALQKANYRNEMNVQVCYCSILEECWIAHLEGTQPEPVKSCS